MPARFLLSAVLMGFVAAFAARPAQAHGDLVALPEAYAPGTIVVKTGERHLYLVVGAGQAIRYPVGVGRAGQQWSGTSAIDAKYVSPDWAAAGHQARESEAAAAHSRRLAAQSDGRRSHDALRPRLRHPRHQSAVFDRPFRLPRLHPHVQRGRDGFVWSGWGGDAGGGGQVVGYQGSGIRQQKVLIPVSRSLSSAPSAAPPAVVSASPAAVEHRCRHVDVISRRNVGIDASGIFVGPT